ncbi:S-layer homology domain-containing protein [Cohnella caldifontis]|uniref:S-layer homology domain-containing protein n=1 Tax=Cohnella caldifontis TaxID=3027471 RepID=UPI0023EBEE08|nr:S-layer homology domain-containing protein [Cohnella sp. YIM B05605]
MWRKNMNPKADIERPFLTAPSVTAPYKAGKLKADYIRDGLNAVNFYRWISGLPADVAAADELNVKAAYGAVLLASKGVFEHEQERPDDMDPDFYDIGLASTSTANIYASYGYDNHILFASVEAYMEDSDTDNLDRLGHRRWILNPPLKLTGMGLAKGTNGFSYTALQVFDDSRKENVDYHYIPYPARGAFPIEVMKPTTAWSVSVNPDEYDLPSRSAVKVTLQRLRDGKTWRLGSGLSRVTESGNYLGVETSGYGTGPAIIFRPANVGAYKAGDVYRVRIDGLKRNDGDAATITYKVEFVSAKNPAPAQAAAKFSDTAAHWARQTIDWAAERGIASGYPDGTFKPSGTVTEAEFLKMFAAAAGANPAPTIPWSDAYYAFAAERGFALQGFDDADARSAPIDREAVAELYASGAGQPLTGDEAIRYMLDNGYSKGKTAATVDGYRGADTLTRAEAVQFIKNALDAGYKLASASVTP